MAPDPKPEKRIEDKALMRSLHLQGVLCVLCGKPGTLHHVYSKGQRGDDVKANLIGLCGDGTQGHHGMMTAEDMATRRHVGIFIIQNRPDTVAYLKQKLGDEQAKEWMWRRLLTPL